MSRRRFGHGPNNVDWVICINIIIQNEGMSSVQCYRMLVQLLYPLVRRYVNFTLIGISESILLSTHVFAQEMYHCGAPATT